MSGHSDAVLYDVHDGVAVMTLNRPERRNAWNVDLGRGMERVFTELSDRPEVRAIILTGAGTAFCSGADLAREFPTGYDGRDDLRALLRDAFHPAMLAMRDVTKPIIAAVNGPAVGAGACLVLAADMSLMSDQAFLQFRFARIGLIPDVGATALLANAVGPQDAAELLMLADRIEPSRCTALRLVQRVVPHGDVLVEAMALARRLADGPTRAYGAMKRALRHCYRPPLAEQLEVEAELQMTLVATEDWAEGRAAFLGHREPKFRGR